MMVKTPEHERASVFCSTNKATQSDSDLSQEGEEGRSSSQSALLAQCAPCWLFLSTSLLSSSTFSLWPATLSPRGIPLKEICCSKQSEKFNFRITCALFLGSIHWKERSIPNRSNAKVSYPSVRPKQQNTQSEGIAFPFRMPSSRHCLDPIITRRLEKGPTHPSR